MKDTSRKKSSFIEKNFSSPTFNMIFTGTIIVLISCFVLVFFIKLFIINEVDHLSYSEKVTPDYKVNLKDNGYYEVKSLPSGMNYIASLVDNIDVNFKYNFEATDVIDYNTTYYIEAITRVYDDKTKTKTLYEKKEILLENRNVKKDNIKNLGFTESVKVDYEHFNSLVRAFKTEYGLSKSSDVTIALVTTTTGGNSEYNGNINLNSQSSIVIPLTEQTINVSINSNNVTNQDRLLEKIGLNNINWYNLIMFVLLTSVDLYLIVRLSKSIKKYLDSFSMYDKTLKKILKDYDSIIANINNDTVTKDDKVIYVESFEELIDIHDNLGSPILFNEAIKGKKAYFTIIDNNMMYRYVLENNKKN